MMSPIISSGRLPGSRHLALSAGCRALIAAALVVGCARSIRPTKTDGGLVLNGEPIHPMSVAPLLSDLANEDARIAAVDLEGSSRTGSHRLAPSVCGGTVAAPDGLGGYIAYQHLGATPKGLHVLVTSVSGGGSGVFRNVIWVRLQHDQVQKEGVSRPRTMLVLVGSFALGDRDDGSVKLEGTRLIVGRSRYRDSAQVIGLE